jgi:hypothetical protein
MADDSDNRSSRQDTRAPVNGVQTKARVFPLTVAGEVLAIAKAPESITNRGC